MKLFTATHPGTLINLYDFLMAQSETALQRKVAGIDNSNAAQVPHGTSVVFGASDVSHCLSAFRFHDVVHGREPFHTSSLALARLAQQFGCLKYTYVDKVETTGARQWCHDSTLFVKPMQMKLFLKMAAGRQYTHLRLALYGGSSAECKAVEIHPFGFGAVESVTLGLCVESTRTLAGPGSGILCLVLTDEEVDRPKSTRARSMRRQSNAIIVYELNLILPLGFVRPLR